MCFNTFKSKFGIFTRKLFVTKRDTLWMSFLESSSSLLHLLVKVVDVYETLLCGQLALDISNFVQNSFSQNIFLFSVWKKTQKEQMLGFLFPSPTYFVSWQYRIDGSPRVAFISQARSTDHGFETILSHPWVSLLSKNAIRWEKWTFWGASNWSFHSVAPMDSNNQATRKRSHRNVTSVCMEVMKIDLLEWRIKFRLVFSSYNEILWLCECVCNWNYRKAFEERPRMHNLDQYFREVSRSLPSHRHPEVHPSSFTQHTKFLCRQCLPCSRLWILTGKLFRRIVDFPLSISPWISFRSVSHSPRPSGSLPDFPLRRCLLPTIFRTERIFSLLRLSCVIDDCFQPSSNSYLKSWGFERRKLSFQTTLSPGLFQAENSGYTDCVVRVMWISLISKRPRHLAETDRQEDHRITRKGRVSLNRGETLDWVCCFVHTRCHLYFLFIKIQKK